MILIPAAAQNPSQQPAAGRCDISGPGPCGPAARDSTAQSYAPSCSSDDRALRERRRAEFWSSASGAERGGQRTRRALLRQQGGSLARQHSAVSATSGNGCRHCHFNSFCHFNSRSVTICGQPCAAPLHPHPSAPPPPRESTRNCRPRRVPPGVRPQPRVCEREGGERHSGL